MTVFLTECRVGLNFLSLDMVLLTAAADCGRRPRASHRITERSSMSGGVEHDAALLDSAG